MGNFAGHQLCETCEKDMIDAGVIGLIFKETIKPKAEFDFGTALTFLKEGLSVARKGWNGKNQFVFLVKGTDLQSSLKYGYGEYVGEPTVVGALAIKTTSNHIQIGWLASQTDMLANDWLVVE